MDSVDSPKIDLQALDPIDRAAFTMGAPALGVYLYLQMKTLQQKRTTWHCWEVREKLQIQEQRTLKKYLEAVEASGMARIIFSPKGDSFLFENWKAPAAVHPQQHDKEGPENYAQAVNFPTTEPEPGVGVPCNLSGLKGKIPPNLQKIRPEGIFSGSKTPIDFGVGVSYKPTTTTELEELEETLKAAANQPLGINQIKFFLGGKILEVATSYDSTLTIPGHLLHAWNSSLHLDDHDLVRVITRIKNAVLYVVQQKTLGLPIKNRIGYFFNAIRWARTPSQRPEKKAVLDRLWPPDRTPDEILKEKIEYWQGLSFEEIRKQYTALHGMGLTDPKKVSGKIFLEGVAMSKFKTDFDTWLAAGGPIGGA